MKKRKCLDHPAMECPSPDEPCVFTKTDKPKRIKQMSWTAKECANMEKSIKRTHATKLSTQSAKLSDLIEFQEASVVSRTLIDKKAGTVTLFAFDKQERLSEHTAPYDALVEIIDGQAEITVSGKAHHLKAGEMITIPANHPHSLKATEKFKMLLTMIRS